MHCCFQECRKHYRKGIVPAVFLLTAFQAAVKVLFFTVVSVALPYEQGVNGGVKNLDSDEYVIDFAYFLI